MKSSILRIIQSLAIIAVLLTQIVQAQTDQWPVGAHTYQEDSSVVGAFKLQRSYDGGTTWENDRESWPVEIRASRVEIQSALFDAQWYPIDEERWAAPTDTWTVAEIHNDYCNCKVGTYLIRYVYVPVLPLGNRRG